MKTALITGASGKIGLALTEEFAKNGYFVIAQYNKNKGEILSLIKSLPNDLAEMVFPVQCDFSKKESVLSFINFLSDNFKSLDVLVNNAGIDVYKLITDTTDEDLEKIVSVNLTSAYKLCRFAAGKMIGKKSGNIINISSVWGSVGAAMETAYSATKGALISLTKALAKELAPSGINVNCVCPGVIDTKMNAIFTESEMKDIIDNIPKGRLGTAEEIAKLVNFLSSPAADYITGQIITADGGFTV